MYECMYIYVGVWSGVDSIVRNVSNLPNHWYAREMLLLLQCTDNKHAAVGLPYLPLPLLLQPRYRFECK